MADDSSSVPFCSSCGKLKEALEAAKKEHSLTLKMVKEKIISTDELIKKYQQKCLESERHRQQVTDYTLKLEAAQMKIESLQGQLDRSLHSTEPLRKNAARLHREKSLADSTTSELRQRLQKLETLNSEMMNTAKLKEQQECAWRLEKQVQAHEFETQRKSLEKSTATVSKLQDQLKKEKDKNKELNKSLTQTKKNIAKLEQQLRESKDEIESVKLDVELAQALGTKQTSKPRLKRKNSQHVQPYKEAEQSSSPVSTQRVAHIIQELRELSDIGTPLSPLPPSPERGSPDISSSSDESDSENGCVDEGNAGDFGDSESSLGDIADLFIGDNNELGEVQESPVRTAVDKPIGDEEIDCKTSKDSVENNSNTDNGKTGREESLGEQASITAVGSPLEGKKNCNKNVHYSVANNRNAEESLVDQTTDQLKASENYSSSNCEVKCNREINISQDLKAAEQGTCSSVAKLDSNLRSTTRRSSERVEEAFKTVKPISASKFAGGSPTRQRKGKRGSMSPITSPSVMTRSRAKAMKLSPSSEADSESEKETGNELNSNRERISKKSGNEMKHDEIARKVKKLTGDNANNERTVTYEHTDDDSHQCRNTSHFGQSADATSSPNMKVAGEDNSKTFLKDSVGSYAKNDIENIATNKCTQSKKIFLQDKNGPGVSENSLQAEETVSEAKEGTLEENNNEILEVFENTPDELEVSSVETNSSHEIEMSVQGSCSVFNSATGGKTSCLPEPATGDVNNENNQPRRVHFLEKDEMKAGANSSDAFARDVFNSLVKGTEDAKPEGSNLTRGGDVSLDPTTMTRAINSSVWESREEGSLDSKSELEKELSSHSSSIVEDETPGVSSSTMDIDLDQVITETATATSYEDIVAETNDDVSSTVKTDDSHVTIATISSASSASIEVKCEDRDSKKSFSTLAEKAISHTSGDVRQVTEVEYELSKTENSIPQAEIFEVARKHSTNQEEKTRNDCKGDRSSCGGQDVELSSSSSLEGEPCEIESVVSTFQVVIDEPGSSNAENSFEANDHSQPSLSGNIVNRLKNPSVKLAQKDTLSIQAVMNDLEDLIGDQFQSLSPLPPSPCPSDDESSPIRDLRIGDFPPLSPLRLSPCSLVDEECPSFPISTSDSNKPFEVAPSGPMVVSRIGDFGQSADATSSPNMMVASEDNSKTFLKEADLVFNSSSKKDANHKSGNLDIENKQDLSFSSTESENKSDVSVNSLTDQKDNAGERLFSDHNSNNADSVGSNAKNDIENMVTNKYTQGKKIFLQDKNGPVVSENSLQAEETVSEAKEGTLEENNNEILEVFENTPDELGVSSVETNSSHETEMSVQGSCSVFNSATGGKTSCLPEPATGDVNNENNQPRRVHFLEKDEMKAGANSSDAFARDVFNSLVKGTEDAKPEGSNLTRGGDVSLDPTTMTRAINSSVWESREEGSLDSKSELEKELSSHSSSIVEDETPGVSSSTMDIDLDQVITETATATSYEDIVAETNDDVSSTAKTDDSHVTIATISSASSASMEVKCEDRDSKKSFSTLTEKAISHTSDDVRQVTEVEYELSKKENSIPQAEIFEVARKHSTNQEEKTHNDYKGDRPSCGGQEVELSSSSSLEGQPCEIESVVSTFQVVTDEPGSSNAENSFEANDHSQPSLSGNTVNKLENPSVKLTQKDTLSIQAVMNDLEDLIGDQFQSLSPLPPSPCPSDDESSPIRDLRIGDFPPLSPLPPSPCSLVDEECPSSPISTSDSNKRTEVAPSGPMAVSRISQHPKQRHPTANYTELSSKTLKRGSLGEGTSFDKRSDDRESLVKIQSAESGRRTVKRTLQQSVSESGNDLDLVPQRKKIKTCKKVNQTQERITLCEGVHTVFETCSTSTLVPGKSKGTVCRGEPVTKKRPSTENINTSDAPLTANQPKQSTSKTCASEAQATTKRNVSNSIEVTEVKDSKHRPLSKRFKGQSEVKYVLRCLTRLYEDSVEVNLVVRRFSTKTCISSCTPLASAIVQFLKTREDEVMFLILAQLEKYKSTERQQEWQPVLSGFEGRLLEAVTQLSDGFVGFGNFISQLASLCSRSLITACGNSKPGDFKGALSLCRVFAALCQLKGDLNCARVVCYDVLRLMYGSQKAALELVVAMVTVWPEILRASRDCWSDDKLPLARTLQVVLLSWADSFSSELGNILRRLCCWGGDPVTQETLKDLGARLVKKLHEESLISVCISQDGNMVADQVSFELVKSLELLCCVLGWQWTMNDLIIDNIWRIVDTWTGLADSDEVGCLTEMAPLVTASTGKQNGIVQKDEDSFARAKSNCRCQTSNDENVCTELPSFEVINGKETKEKNQMDVGEGCEVCQKCGQLKKQRLAESQIVVCIQLLGVLCKIAIENHQAAVLEIEDLLCGLVEETSPSKVTYAIQLAATGSLLDMSPWQPQRVTTVISKWLAGVKESCSLKAPACITQGLLCLKSIMMSYPAKQGAATLS